MKTFLAVLMAVFCEIIFVGTLFSPLIEAQIRTQRESRVGQPTQSKNSTVTDCWAYGLDIVLRGDLIKYRTGISGTDGNTYAQPDFTCRYTDVRVTAPNGASKNMTYREFLEKLGFTEADMKELK